MDPISLIDPQIGAALIEASHAQISPLLLNAAHHLGGIDEVFAYRQDGSFEPTVLASASCLPDAEARVSLYTHRFYRFDPAAQSRIGTSSGSGFVNAVRAADISAREYRAICFERPRFVEKVCYGWRSHGHWVVLSFYNHRHSDPITQSRLAALANAALTSFVLRQEESTRQLTPLLSRIERRLKLAYPNLTSRESAVCSRTLAGCTAHSIAIELGISRSTVLTYRLRAYRRLGITSANALLERMLD